MSLTSNEIRQIKDKVSYSEIDTCFTKYMEGVTNTINLCNKVLHGELPKPIEDNKETLIFNSDTVRKLSELTDLHFLEVQSSIDIKKTTVENWQQSNDKVKNDIENNVSEVIPELKAIHGRLRGRIQKIEALYQSVRFINNGFSELATKKTELTVTQEEWEDELGKELTKELIDKKCLQTGSNSRYANSGKNGNPTKARYGAYEDFSKGPKEAKQLNETMKSDIEKLTKEIDDFKKKWEKDADVSTKVANVLQEELSRRDQDFNELDVEMDGNEDSDEEDVEDERSQRQLYDNNNDNEDDSSNNDDDESERNEEGNGQLSDSPTDVVNAEDEADMEEEEDEANMKEEEDEAQDISNGFESQTASVEPGIGEESDRRDEVIADNELASDAPSKFDESNLS
ncbi:hypothetical protein C6P45_001675 [Maudiozyma exigua]|uniref:Uncharacterized protein n=1 Tax=Maudiozyma exigua TaxID=34358 RepID=A0A9P6WEA8_MAUEX|nr:hypothetical protein C6P45_001675 [Kazachstania exigua]